MAWQRALRYIVLHDRKFRQQMQADGAVGTDAKRFYARGEAPQSVTLPYVVYQGIGQAGESEHQQGVGNLWGDDVLIVVVAANYSAAVELLQIVLNASLGQRGTFDEEELLGIFSSQRRTDPEMTADESEHKLHTASAVVTIWYRE
jgi:hypothetical protein